MASTTDNSRTPPRSRPWNGAALRERFADAGITMPWTLAYQSVDVEELSAETQVAGKMPDGLRGTLYRNGPARHERGGQRYAHRWDGDGMIQQFRFHENGVSHLGRYIATQKHRLESERDAFVATTFGTAVPGSRNDEEGLALANAANINVVPFDGELLALWEAGPAYRVHPDTLATLGLRTWGASLQRAPFSAHPKVDNDGTMWNFGIDPIKDELFIYCLEPGRGLVRGHRMHVPQLAPAHDFVATRAHLVFLLPSMLVDKDRINAGVSFGESCQWLPSIGMRALVVSKEDWSTRVYELPPGCLFHIANAWERDDGCIDVEYLRAETPMSLLAGWTIMQGEYRHRDGAHLTRLMLNPRTGRASQETIEETDAEFPVVDAADAGVRCSPVLCLERSATRPSDVPGFDRVSVLDTQSGSKQSFAYGSDWLVEEHVLAGPRGGAPRWIVGAALDTGQRQTVVSAFHVNNVEAGPLMQARLPYALPLGLHGCFVA